MDKKWDARLDAKLEAKLEAKFEEKLAPIYSDLRVLREGMKIILTTLDKKRG